MEVIKIIDHIWWEEKEEFLLAEDQDSFWVLYLLVEGECYYKIGEVSGIAKSPCVLICPPHTVFERKVLAPLSFHFFRLDVVPNQSYLNLSAGMHRLTKERLAMDQMVLNNMSMICLDSVFLYEPIASWTYFYSAVFLIKNRISRFPHCGPIIHVLSTCCIISIIIIKRIFRSNNSVKNILSMRLIFLVCSKKKQAIHQKNIC